MEHRHIETWNYAKFKFPVIRFKMSTPSLEKHLHTFTCAPCCRTSWVQVGLNLSLSHRLILELRLQLNLWNRDSSLKTTCTHISISKLCLGQAHYKLIFLYLSLIYSLQALWWLIYLYLIRMWLTVYQEILTSIHIINKGNTS